jgi:hypothetical protein
MTFELHPIGPLNPLRQLLRSPEAPVKVIATATFALRKGCSRPADHRMDVDDGKR